MAWDKLISFILNLNWERIIWWIGSIIAIPLGIYELYKILINKPKFIVELKNTKITQYHEDNDYGENFPARLIINGIFYNRGYKPITLKKIELKSRQFYDYDFKDNNGTIGIKLEPHSEIIKLDISFLMYSKIESKEIIGDLLFYSSSDKIIFKCKLLVSVED